MTPIESCAGRIGRTGPALSIERVHGELAEKTIGLLGYGHIGKAVAVRAKALEMNVHVANRSAVEPSSVVDRSFTWDDLGEFWKMADFFVVSVPLTAETTGMVDAEAFAAMRSGAVVMNVGRGPTIDEHAIIDTWYNYPSPQRVDVLPSSLPFHPLPNIVMTPHISGWTAGTIRRRQQTTAANIRRRANSELCVNVIRAALTTAS